MDTIRSRKLKLSIMSENDIQGLVALSKLVGWDYDTDEITTLMSSGKIFGHKDEFGQIVSSAAIIPYDTYLASLGMVIVNHKYRGQGLGKEVTQACIDLVNKNTSIMLIATPEGKPLYEKMGFKVVGYVHKLICNNYIPSEKVLLKNLTVDTLKESDLDKIVELDKDAFGDSRRKFLINRIKQSHQSLVLRDEFGCVLGFGLSILGPENLIIGPIVAPNLEASCYLTNQLALNHNGRLRIDIPKEDEMFMNFLKERVFDKVGQPPIMIINSETMPFRNNNLYGIAAQAFG